VTKKRNATKTETGLLLPEAVGLAAEKYAAAVKYLFDRPEVSPTIGEEWYWNHDEPDFEATPLEWVQIQTLLFSRAGTDLANYSDEQIGMGLNYVMSNSVSEIAFSPLDESVGMPRTLKMMEAFPSLWRDCIGPRTKDWRYSIGNNKGRLGFVCYMWFDVWPLPWNLRESTEFNSGLWMSLKEILSVPSREVQIAALHGVGHLKGQIGRDAEVEEHVRAFWMNLKDSDDELKSYAKAAATGMVQ
jgi:hypothetical protein